MQDCMRKVETKAVILRVKNVLYAGHALQDNCPFLGARKERKEHPPSPRPRFLGGVDVVAFGYALPVEASLKKE